MQRRAFLETINNHYLDDFVYISYYPLYNRGFEVILFDGHDMENTLSIHNPTKEDVIFGSVEATNFYFNYIGVKSPSYLGYPEELKPFLLRNVYKVEYGKINSKYPYFVKPAEGVKTFTGTLIRDENSEKLLKEFNNLTDQTLVWFSEPIDFISEFRCFVHNKELKGIQYYIGDFTKFPNTEKILEMVKTYQTSNCSYTLDVGVTKTGKTALVEVNDMWAIGSYGFEPKTYVRMCIDRLLEIIKP